jgi:prepilin-type N-terminal cleavage/methylation domain-containing protein
MRIEGRQLGFTLVELLVVVSIIAVLVGILLPVLAATRSTVQKTTCAGNLRQLGIAVQAHRTDHKDRLPTARYMPEPFLSVDDDPGLPEAMRGYLPREGGKTNAVYRCPDDAVVYDLCGTSYDYVSMFSGLRPKDIFFIRMGGVTEADIILSRDFDNAAADIATSDEPLQIPSRHLRRNNLWLDGRVEVIQTEG